MTIERCCSKLIRRKVLERDTDDQRRVRTVTLPFYVFLFGITTVGTIDAISIGFTNSIYMCISAMSCGVFVLFTMPAMTLSHMCPRKIMRVMFVWILLGIVCYDWFSAAVLRPRVWDVVVLVLDATLVFNESTLLQRVILAGTLVWLIVERSEYALRYGLYELAFFNDRLPNDAWDCGTPPCAQHPLTALMSFLGSAVVLLTDYYFTRSFAVGLRDRVSEIEASVEVASRIADYLANYSIAEASQALREEGERLPDAMLESLRDILANLECYRPYLPDALLTRHAAATSPSMVSVQAPGSLGDGESDVCICFTDIQSSTALWEDHPQGMYVGLELHNVLMRKLAETNGGYEVKTIGDAFMLAFSSAVKACAFGVRAQDELVDAAWPSDLLASDLCAPMHTKSGALVFSGLRVRIGINTGAVRIGRNPVTQRCDYYGPVVNVAARIESALKLGGLTGVSAEVFRRLQEDGDEARAVGGYSARKLPPKELKGVSGGVSIYVLLSERLKDRIPLLLDQEDDTTTSKSDTILLRAPTSQSGFLHSPLRVPRAREQTGRSSDADSLESSLLARSFRVSGLHLGLRSSMVTCAFIRMVLLPASRQRLEPAVCSFVASVSRAADESGGELQKVLSTAVVVTWNTASKPCSAHFTRPHSFLTGLQRTDLWDDVSGGIATTHAFQGTVYGGRQRHVTVVGECVELSAALADEARLCGDKGLCVGPVAEYFASIGNAYRAQVWSVGGVRLHVWQVALDDCASDNKWDMYLQPQPRARNPDVEMMFDAALERAAAPGGMCGQDAIRQALADVPECDDRVRKLIRRARDGHIAGRHLTSIWDELTVGGLSSGEYSPSGLSSGRMRTGTGVSAVVAPLSTNVQASPSAGASPTF